MTGSLWVPLRIADRASGQESNFNLRRVLAAIGVLISHAYPVSLGSRVPAMQVTLKKAILLRRKNSLIMKIM